jgi:S-adenosylmethionine:tRNA ribosyltransferase-isomerase
MRVDDFAFDLPRALIATHPCEPRDTTRLSVTLASGQFEERQIADLPTPLYPDVLLVFSATKVILSRFIGAKSMLGNSSYRPRLCSGTSRE